MNASKRIGLAGLGLTITIATASAEPGLNAHSQTKVNNAKAKMWTRGDNPNDQKTVVNIGSRRNNTCNVNVGTAKPGEKVKEIVVTTKEVINVCK